MSSALPASINAIINDIKLPMKIVNDTLLLYSLTELLNYLKHIAQSLLMKSMNPARNL